MMPTDLARQRDRLLEPAQIAKICAGRVLRRGEPAGRVVTDSRELQPGDCFVALPGDANDGHDYLEMAFARGAAGAVVCRPVAKGRLHKGSFVVKVEDTFAALMDLAQAYRDAASAKVVGITGSCGKTSTKDMLGEVLERLMPTVRSPKSYNNHIGVPLTLFQLQPDTRAAVIEIGTNAPGEIEQLAALARPDIGIVTRIDDSHLQKLGSRAGVAEEKSNLIAALPENGLAILNGDDPACVGMAEVSDAPVQFVRVDAEADWFATDVSFHGLGTSFRLQGETPVTLPRLGSHNVHNALFSIAAARALDVPLDAILAGLCEVQPSARRLECKKVGEVSIIDDTYNSNPASARAALIALSGLRAQSRRIAVLGEMLELGDLSDQLHAEVGAQVAAYDVDLLVAVGPGTAGLAEAARRAGMRKDQVRHLPDAEAAIAELEAELRPGDWLLCKASRGVGLDRLVDALQQRLGSAGGT